MTRIPLAIWIGLASCFGTNIFLCWRGTAAKMSTNLRMEKHVKLPHKLANFFDLPFYLSLFEFFLQIKTPLLRSTVLTFVFCSPIWVTLVKSFNSMNCMNHILFFLEGETKKINFCFREVVLLFLRCEWESLLQQTTNGSECFDCGFGLTQEMEALLFLIIIGDLSCFFCFFFMFTETVSGSFDSHQSAAENR